MKKALANLTLFIVLLGCSPSSENSLPLSSTLSGGVGKRLLFVASGTCYGGGVAVSTGSNTVAAFDLDTGTYRRTVVDYNVASPGDTPVAMTDYDDEHLLVVVENVAGRRIDIVNKDGSGAQSFLTNATALNAVLRSIRRNSDGSLLVGKLTAVEKFSSSKVRLTQGANPFVNNPAGSCATTNTQLTDVDSLSNGKIIYTHAAANPNNKVVIVSATGYAAGGDCLGVSAAPATTALPTNLLIHPSGKLLVSYGSTTLASNSIQSYDLDVTANTITNATAAFSDTSIVNGPSSMAVDSDTGRVFVANALSTFNTIESFTLSGGTLTRQGSAPFAGPNIYTRCVSSMYVMRSP